MRPPIPSASLSRENLRTYLSDHLAGSLAAVKLLDHLIKASTAIVRQAAMKLLRHEIESDQEILRQVLQTLGAEESVWKDAGAWLAEKLALGKLKIADLATGHLGELEALEMLSLGIEGKTSLWVALGGIQDDYPEVELDWMGLEERARRQRQQVETWRLQTARDALGA